MIGDFPHAGAFRAQSHGRPHGTRGLDAGEMAAFEMSVEALGDVDPPHGGVIDRLPLRQAMSLEAHVLLEKPVFLQRVEMLPERAGAAKMSPGSWGSVGDSFYQKHSFLAGEGLTWKKMLTGRFAIAIG